jgi:hypothetical protein
MTRCPRCMHYDAPPRINRIYRCGVSNEKGYLGMRMFPGCRCQDFRAVCKKRRAKQ